MEGIMRARRPPFVPVSSSRSINDRQLPGLNLPTEILLHITSHLRKRDWLSLRLVSRSLYAFSANLPIITHLWFGPYSEDRSAFVHICNHPFLGSHVTTIIYDVTRFEDFSEEELRKRWPRPQWRERHRPREKRKTWIENHPGILQYLKLIEEQKSRSIDEVELLAEGLKRLQRVRTIRLAFAFQMERLMTHKERLSPLRRYSDLEWISPGGHNCKPWKVQVNARHVRNILNAIVKSNAQIQELDFWQDYMSIPLEAFIFGDEIEDIGVIFGSLTRLTTRFSEASLLNRSAVLPFRELLRFAKNLREFCLCVDGHYGFPDVIRDKFGLLMDDLMPAGMQLRTMKWTGRHPPYWEPNLHMGIGFDRPCPGSIFILHE